MFIFIHGLGVQTIIFKLKVQEQSSPLLLNELLQKFAM